jgi:hypothetical protein
MMMQSLDSRSRQGFQDKISIKQKAAVTSPPNPGTKGKKKQTHTPWQLGVMNDKFHQKQSRSNQLPLKRSLSGPK